VDLKGEVVKVFWRKRPLKGDWTLRDVPIFFWSEDVGLEDVLEALRKEEGWVLLRFFERAPIKLVLMALKEVEKEKEVTRLFSRVAGMLSPDTRLKWETYLKAVYGNLEGRAEEGP